MLKNYTKIMVNKDGDKFYLNDEGQHHRLDGPAFEYSDGSKEWAINGNFHRNIDPSVEQTDGRKYWFFKNKGHRIGGSFSSTQKCWFIFDKRYTKKQYFNKVWKI